MNLPTEPLQWNVDFKSDLKHWWGMRRRKATRVIWRTANQEEREWLKTQPRIDELGDFLFVTPDVEGELWLLIERVWNGWPDPPLYAFLAFDPDGKLLAAQDFAFAPRRWTVPE